MSLTEKPVNEARTRLLVLLDNCLLSISQLLSYLQLIHLNIYFNALVSKHHKFVSKKLFKEYQDLSMDDGEEIIDSCGEYMYILNSILWSKNEYYMNKQTPHIYIY